MNNKTSILFLLLFSLGSNSQTTNSFLNRGVISSALGKSGIVGNYYSESVLCNPANLYTIDTFDLGFYLNNPRSMFISYSYNFKHSTTIGFSYYERIHHYNSDSLIIYRNIISLSNLIHQRGTNIPIFSVGINVISLGIQKDYFQQEIAEFGFNLLTRYISIGSVISSPTTLYIDNSTKFDIPLMAGMGVEIPLDTIFKSAFWKMRIDYMYTDKVENPNKLSNSSNLFFGLKRGYIFPFFYTGTGKMKSILKFKWYDFVLLTLDGIVPYCYGISLNNINNNHSSFYPEYHLGWANITIFDAPLHLEPNFRLNISFSHSKYDNKLNFGISLGYR